MASRLATHGLIWAAALARHSGLQMGRRFPSPTFGEMVDRVLSSTSPGSASTSIEGRGLSKPRRCDPMRLPPERTELLHELGQATFHSGKDRVPLFVRETQFKLVSQTEH